MPSPLETEISEPRDGADASTTGRWVPVQVVVQTARGPRYFGKIERNVLVFFGLHVVGVAALLLTKTHLFAVFEGAVHFRSLYDVSYAAFTVSVLAGHAYQYLELYGSDPGWITFDSKLDDPQVPCSYCRMAPSLRSRHDFNTGQCVHKFDHFCWLLGTAIGDCNHLRFWCFNLVQTFLVLWAIVLAGHSVLSCIHMEACRLDTLPMVTLIGLLLFLFMAFNVFAGLLAFHSYLAATNQTTYEVMKGEKVPYLKAFYAQYNGPKHTKLVGRQLRDFLWRVVRGKGPPAPFSAREGPLGGIAANLELFFFVKKPHTYRLNTLPPGEDTAV